MIYVFEVECCMELWAGYFGVDADGTQPECGHTNRIELSEDEVEWISGEPQPVCEYSCTKCGCPIEPDTWDEWEKLQ